MGTAKSEYFKGIAMWMVMAAGCCWAGDVRGRVEIPKPLTRQRVVLPDSIVRDAALSYVERSSPSAQSKDGLAEEFGRTVVYLRAPHAIQGRPVRASIVQQDQTFLPEVLAVPTGSTVDFPNADSISHNAFSISKTKAFNLGNSPQGSTRSVPFDHPGVVEVYCNLHSNMSAAIVVVPSRWWTKPAKDGSFLFFAVPAGEYDLVVWHKSAGSRVEKISVTTNGVVNVTILIAAETRSALK